MFVSWEGFNPRSVGRNFDLLSRARSLELVQVFAVRVVFVHTHLVRSHEAVLLLRRHAEYRSSACALHYAACSERVKMVDLPPATSTRKYFSEKVSALSCEALRS